VSPSSFIIIMQTKLVTDLAQNIFDYADIDTKLRMETALRQTFTRFRVSNPIIETTFLTPPEYGRLVSGDETWSAATKSRRFEHIYLEQHTGDTILKRYYLVEHKTASHRYREICACGVYMDSCHCENIYWSLYK